jgi:hypothetical protein
VLPVSERQGGEVVQGIPLAWIKVKRQRTADCAVIGVTGDWSRPSLVLGLRHADGLLHHLGRLDRVCVIFYATEVHRCAAEIL